MFKAFINNFTKPAGAVIDANWQQCIELLDYPEKHFCQHCGRQSKWYAEPLSWDAKSGERTYWIKTVCSCSGFQYHFTSIGIPNQSRYISPNSPMHLSDTKRCKYCNMPMNISELNCSHCGGPQG